MILAMILLDVLQREMGLNISRVDSPCSFGMSAKKEELVDPPIFFDLYMNLIIMMKSCLIMCQHFFYRNEG